MNNAYSPLKIFHHQRTLQKMRMGQHVSPIHVQLVPTNRCNQSCKGCAYRAVGYTSNQTFDTRDEIPWEKLKEIVEDCKTLGVQAIELTGGGEPTVHPEFLGLASLILSSGIKLGLVTNGVRWTSEHSEILADASWVRFSVDAGSASTYAEYRRNPIDTYQKVLDNVKSFMALRPSALVGVGFVLTESNWGEVFDAANAARDLGVDNFRISALFQSLGFKYFREFHSEAYAECKRAETLTTDKFRVFNLFGDRIEDLQLERPHYTDCGYSKVSTYIGADLHLYPCCNLAYSKRGAIGSLRNQTFAATWNSRDVVEHLKNLDARNCPRCMYNNKNTTIQYALSDDPTHKEFI